MNQYKWEILEQEFLCEKKKRKEKTFLIGEIKMNIKYIHKSGDSKNTYVFLHGTASDSTSFVTTIQDLPDNANIYLIDIPGFGKSTIENFEDTYDFQETLENLILESLHLFIKDINDNKDNKDIKDIAKQSRVNSIKLVGHSFGGFLAILYTNKYPEYIKSLILIAPAGIFPAIGGFGCYWAIFFKLGLPYTLIALLSFLNILNVLNVFIRIAEFCGITITNRLMHDIDVYSQNNIIGHRLVASYITLFWNEIFPMTYWNKPILDILLKLNTQKKVKVLFGKYDTIIPYHQGEFLKDLGIDVEISECYHGVYYGKWAITCNNGFKIKWKKSCKKIIKFDESIFPNPEIYACGLNVKQANNTILKMYDEIETKIKKL